MPDAGPLLDDHHEIAATAMLGDDEPSELYKLERAVFALTWKHLRRTRPGSKYEHARVAGRAAEVVARTVVEDQTVQCAASQLGIGKRTAEDAKRLALDALAAVRLEDGELPEPSATVAALYRPSNLAA